MAARAADVDPAKLTFAKDVRPLLETYCGKCHGGDAHKGDVSLAAFKDDSAVDANPKVWRVVLAQVGEHTMPPASKPQPTPAERQRIVDYVTHRLNNPDLSKIKPDPGRVTIRRLNRQEYNNTLRDLLGVHTRPADAFPADGGGGAGFDNNGDTLFLPPVLMEMYLKAAGDALAGAERDKVVMVKPVDGGAAAGGAKVREAARANVERFVTRAFRRPATAAEVDRFLKLFDAAYARLGAQPQQREGAAFAGALRAAYKAVLVSPHFLFRVEQARGPAGAAHAISDYELASRLSYFVWASMPDDELMDLARQGKLRDDATIDRQVRRMLKDPKSRALAEHFGGQWLGVNELLTTAAPDRERFPQYSSALRDSLYNQAVAFVDSVFRDDRPLTTLIASDYTFLNNVTARHYGVTKVSGEEMRRVDLKPAERVRGGILGLGAVHVVTSYPLRTSPVIRGKWVLETVLGAPPPPPPPDAGKLPDDDKGTDGLSLRQRLEKHRQDPACASCHARMDPLGFGLENFDAIGRWRELDANGAKVDSVGKLTSGQTFTGPAELQQILLAKRGEFARTVAEKMLSYALGRGVETYDLPVVKKITDALAGADYAAGTLVVEIARSYPFRYRKD